MVGACRTYGERRSACRDLVVKLGRKRPLGRTKLRWDDNIKMDLQEVGWVAWTEFIWLLIWTCERHL